MLNKILVCLDGSRFAEGVLPFAIERANRFNSKIILLHVINSPMATYLASAPAIAGQSMPIIAQPNLDLLIREEEKKDKSYLDRTVVRLNKIGLDAEFTTRRRTAGETIGDTIIHYASECKADLIMMAIHKRSFWRRFIFGSVTESVIRKSASPVLVVNPRSHRARVQSLETLPQPSPV